MQQADEDQGLEQVRADVKANLKELDNRAKMFGRVNWFSEKYMEQPPRPFPQYFAWTKAETKDNLNSKKISPVNHIQVLPSKTSAKKSKIVIKPAEVVPVSPPASAQTNHSSTGSNNATVILEKSSPTLEMAKDTSPADSVVSFPLVPDGNKSVPQQSTDTSEISDTAPSTTLTAAEPVTTKLEAGIDKKDQVPAVAPAIDPASEPEKTAIVEKGGQKKNSVSQVHKDIAPLLLLSSGGGGGLRKAGALDQLSILCKTHQKQYDKCRVDIESHASQKAGLILAKDQAAPTFFAWKEESLVEKDRLEPRTHEAPSKNENEIPSAGTSTLWEKNAPTFYAWNELQPERVEQQRLREESRANVQLLAAGPVIAQPQPRAPETLEVQEESTGPEAEERLDEKERQSTLQEIQDKLEQHLATRLCEAILPVFPSELEPALEITPAPTKCISSPKKLLPPAQQLILKAQRAVGQKHHKCQSELQQGYVRRTEYMSKFQWPAPDLTQGTVRSISAFASRQCTRPAGMASSYRPTFVGSSAQVGLDIAQNVAHEFLKKRLVVGGIEALEEKASILKPSGHGRSKVMRPRKQRNDTPPKKYWVTSTNPNPKLRKTDRAPPLHFAWQNPKAEEASKQQVQWAFRKKSSRPKVQRWKPTRTLANPILNARRHPISVYYRPRTEYARTISRIGHRLLRTSLSTK